MVKPLAQIVFNFAVCSRNLMGGSGIDTAIMHNKERV